MNTNETLHGVVTALRRKEAATAIVFEFDLREANGTTRRVQWSTDPAGQVKEGDTVTVVGHPDPNNILDARSLSIEPVRTARPIPWMLLSMPLVALVATVILGALSTRSDQLEGMVGTLMAAGVVVALRKKWRSGPMAKPILVVALTAIGIGILNATSLASADDLAVLLLIVTIASAAYAVFLLYRNRSQRSLQQ